MVDFVDLHYATMLSGRLERFRVKSTNPYKINFRCPVCGDSQKSQAKARAWLLEKDNSFRFYCHNCGASQSFSYFLQNIDNLAYNDYVAEKFVSKTKDAPKEVNNDDQFKTKAPNFSKKNPLSKIKKISQLKVNHPVKQYIVRRGIPPEHHYRMYLVKKFKTWINEIIPNKFENVKQDEPRLVIPFFDENGKMFGVSARSFDPNTSLRYITIMFKEQPKIFGLDKVNMNKRYFVVEGALDSMFLSNAVAMAGAEGSTSALTNIKNAIFVFDAEPRNKEIHKRMEKVISNGHKICIWPSNVPGKDINEMFLAGKTDVEQTIINNTYSSLEANLKLMAWRKT